MALHPSADLTNLPLRRQRDARFAPSCDSPRGVRAKGPLTLSDYPFRMMVRRLAAILRSLVADERGNVLAMTAIGIPLLLGCAGLAVDTIQWVSAKRELQSAADAAATDR